MFIVKLVHSSKIALHACKVMYQLMGHVKIQINYV